MARKPAAPPTPDWKLEGDLDVFSVHLQWERLLPLLNQEPGTVLLDLGGVGDLDLSGLQMLCALKRDLHARGIVLQLQGARDAWTTRFAPLGMATVFSESAP